MQAICSDIHANLEAFEVVLADMDKNGVTEVVCLGDIIGYGPNPKECLDLTRQFGIGIQGNHEQALMVQMESATFNYRARSSLDWTRMQLDMLGAEREENARRWDQMAALRGTYTTNGNLYVHGTPRGPVCEYLYARDLYRPEKVAENFSMIEWACFVGHTHVPGIFTEDMIYLTPQEVNYRYRLGTKKSIVNVGSIGQPRDGDIRASYVLRDGDTVLFRRLDYPVEKTAAKIRTIVDLPDFLAERLHEGR